MLTLFTIPKPFKGHIATIQRNALRSWRESIPDGEVLLMGDEPGVAEEAREIGAGHIADVAHNEFGTPLVSAVFERAEQEARFDTLAFVNTDILLLEDFAQAVRRVPLAHYLMVGGRTNLKIELPVEFQSGDWQEQLRQRVFRGGRRQKPAGMDYFVYRRGTWPEIPPFAVGRFWWDNWLVYSARMRGVPVIDATAAVTAIHQDHEYAHPSASGDLRSGLEVLRNAELGRAGRWYTYHDADWKLLPKASRREQRMGELTRNWISYVKPCVRLARQLAEQTGVTIERPLTGRGQSAPRSKAAA